MPPLPLPILPGVYYGRVEGTFEGRPSTNIFAFQKTGLVINDPQDLLNATSVAIALAAHWHLVTATTMQASYAGVQASCYALGTHLMPLITEPMTAAGGDASPIATMASAGVIKHTVFRRGRGSQSRTFITPMARDAVTADGGSATPLWISNANTNFPLFMNAVLADLNTASPGAWFYGQVSKRPVGAFYQIVASEAETLLSSQKARGLR